MIDHDRIKRKMRTFRKDPFGSSSAKLKQWLSPDKIVDRVYHKRILRRKYEESYRIISEIRKGNALFGSYYKYVHLHKLLAGLQPNSILEFGSGSTTGIFAVYARKFNARVRTVEDNPSWMENTRGALGDLAAQVDFVLSPVAEELGNPNRCFYRYTPAELFDFVYVDGPPLVINGQSDRSAVNWNIVEMIGRGFGPRTIVIDMRLATAEYIAKKFSNDYKAYLLEKKHRFLDYRYHSFFVRRDPL
ncbi:MAG: hypothetical protein A2Y81_05860 [Nitrospirae bacterium RBG_13_43_8]|nr:MAG: hypothetical protein A2Y81_05860 [Nitrospirae bacterium RBG_13_43_8]